jgi:hypothetical protein
MPVRLRVLDRLGMPVLSRVPVRSRMPVLSVSRMQVLSRVPVLYIHMHHFSLRFRSVFYFDSTISNRSLCSNDIIFELISKASICANPFTALESVAAVTIRGTSRLFGLTNHFAHVRGGRSLRG